MKRIYVALFLSVLSFIARAQNVGINTNTPQASLDIKGNQRVGGINQFMAYDSIGGKITWSNSHLFVPATQYLMKHSASSEGLYYENAQLQYRDQAGNPVFYTNWNNGHGYFSNRLGIGTTTPIAPLSFSSTPGQKVSFYGSGAPHYGIGIQPFQLQIHTDGPGADIVFGHGSSEAFTEVVRLRGNGAIAVNGNTGTAGQVLTSAGSSAGAEWKNQSRRIFFQYPEGSPQVPITSVYQTVPDIHNQTFTIGVNSTVIITYSIVIIAPLTGANAEGITFLLYLSGPTPVKPMFGYDYIQPQLDGIVSTVTVTKYYTGMAQGTYTIESYIKRSHSLATWNLYAAQAIIEIIPQ